MMKSQKRAGLILLAWAMLAVFGCIDSGDSSSGGAVEEEVAVEEPAHEEEAQPAGQVAPEIVVVALGPSANDVTPIESSEPFYEGNAIQVREGGLAYLSFGDRAAVYLTNNSGLVVGTVDQSATSVENRIILESMEGGLIGTLNQGEGPFVVRTPGGAEITISGTDFFVVYDAEAALTVAGNFEGGVSYAGPVTPAGDLGSGHFVVIPDNSAVAESVIPAWLEGRGVITMDFSAFLELAVNEGTALAPVTMMTTADVNICPDDSCILIDSVDTQISVCGDGVCAEGNENVLTCEADCGTCGDGYCSDNRDERSTCPVDCGPF